MKIALPVVVLLTFFSALPWAKPQTEQETFEFFDRFFNVPQRANLAEKAAQISFAQYMLQRDGLPSKPAGAREAVLELWNRLPPYADQKFGNRNGIGELRELQRLTRKLSRHASYKTLKKLFADHGLEYSNWTM